MLIILILIIIRCLVVALVVVFAPGAPARASPSAGPAARRPRPLGRAWL